MCVDTSHKNTVLVCDNCITNNWIFSCVKNTVNYVNYGLFKLKAIGGINKICASRITFSIKKATYMATDTYVIHGIPPHIISIENYLSIDDDLPSNENQYNLHIDILETIKSCKNPEEAINTINTLLIFN
jgi:hypothetical protein